VSPGLMRLFRLSGLSSPARILMLLRRFAPGPAPRVGTGAIAAVGDLTGHWMPGAHVRGLVGTSIVRTFAGPPELISS
jgi:hypothetical protein